MATRIIIVVYALEGSPKIGYAKRTLNNVLQTTNFDRHELFISDNGSRGEMLEFYKDFQVRFGQNFKEKNLTISLNGENLGTSGGVNLGIKTRKLGQFCVKMDDDMVITTKDWVEQMEECFDRLPGLGIVGVKRRELIQCPDHLQAEYRTILKYLPHERGQSWVPVEICEDIIGSTVMLSPRLLDRIGYFSQPSNYGGDDVILSARSIKAGFTNIFLPGIACSHIDTGEGEFVEWKRKHAGEIMESIVEWKDETLSGVRDVFVDPYDD